METLRCPTCVALLPDPEARRCPLCHTKLRKKRRGRAIVLGESNRRSGRSLPDDVELHVRAEERFLPDEKKLEEIVHDPAHLPGPTTPVAPFAPLTAAPPETVEAVLAFSAAEPEAEVEPVAETGPEPDIDLTAEAAPEPVIDPATGTISAPPDEEAPDARPKSPWQPVPARGGSPLDGNLNDIVGELHRKAREDGENHTTR
jgi:hypothetical protein